MSAGLSERQIVGVVNWLAECRLNLWIKLRDANGDYDALVAYGREFEAGLDKAWHELRAARAGYVELPVPEPPRCGAGSLCADAVDGQGAVLPASRTKPSKFCGDRCRKRAVRSTT